MSIQVSRQLRLALEAQFASDFNANLGAACEEFGIAGLAFAINFAEKADEPQNFYRGDRSLDSLFLHDEPDLPALAFWTGEGQDLQLEHPRIFSGQVAAHWRFFLSLRGVRAKGMTDLREAVESAVIETLDPELPGFGYSGLAWQPLAEQQFFDQDQQHVGWVQEINYTATFEVRA